MPQCVWVQNDAKGGPQKLEAWHCQEPEHPAGDDGQAGHALPPNAAGSGKWYRLGV